MTTASNRSHHPRAVRPDVDLAFRDLVAAWEDHHRLSASDDFAARTDARLRLDAARRRSRRAGRMIDD